jgi:peroxiredoxin
MRRIGLLLTIVFALCSSPLAGGQDAAEKRVIDYLRENLKPGQPVLITELYGKVFPEPEERQALDKLYRAFFRIPLFLAQHQERLGAPPGLKTVAEQFDLGSADAADVLLQVMEADPRVPRFLERDPQSGEITRVDVERIRGDSRFGKVVERQLSGWEGRPAPEFQLAELRGGEVRLTELRDHVVLLYVWFTGCPPCVKQTPDLAELDGELAPRGLRIVGANADRVLGLGYDDSVRMGYLEKEGVRFPTVHWTKESDTAYGSIAIYPTLFLIGRDGVIRRHWVGYVPREELRRAIEAGLKPLALLRHLD